MRLFATLFAMLLWLSTIPRASAMVELTSNTNETVNLAPHLEIFEDSTTHLTLEQVRQKNAFTQNGNNHPIPGYTQSAWWVRFSLKNPTPQTQKRYVEYSDSGEGIPSITFFVPNSLGEYSANALGGTLAQQEKPVDHRHAVIPVLVPPNATSTVYVRAQGDSIKIPLYLYTSQSLFEFDYGDMLWVGAVYGFLLVLVASNLAVFLATADRSYLYYVGFVLGLVLTLGTFDGITGQYFFTNSRYIFMRTVNIASSSAIAFLLLFTTEFLNLKKHQPFFDRVCRYAAAVAFAVAIFNIFWKQNLLVNITISTCALMCIVVSIAVAMRRVPLARINLVPISAFLMAVIVTSLKQAGLLPSVFITEEALRIGAMCNALLWALALAYRIRHTMEEHHNIQMKTLEIEISAQKNHLKSLQDLVKLVVDISDKLNSPLLVIIHVIDRIREKAQHLEFDPIHKNSSLPNELNKFLLCWSDSLPKISEAINSLKNLSGELSERREEHSTIAKTECGNET